MSKKFSHNTISIYKFISIKNVFKFKNILNKILKKYNLRGIILIAPEGLNMNVSIFSLEFENFLKDLAKLFEFSKNELKVSDCNAHIFRKLKIKIKREILSTRNKVNILENNKIGKYISPQDWENFIKEEDVILVDTRNDYEIRVGTFKKSLNPQCRDFTEILNWISNNLLKENNIHKKKIAMFCTGGIRCEKASSLMKTKGFQNVYHLKGGILKYFESIPEDKSMWEGECFVFDDRVSLKHDLTEGTYDMCHGCRMPITHKEKNSKKYIRGVACPNCFDKTSEEQKSRYMSRQKQVDLAKKRNKKHIGPKEEVFN